MWDTVVILIFLNNSEIMNGIRAKSGTRSTQYTATILSTIFFQKVRLTNENDQICALIDENKVYVD